MLINNELIWVAIPKCASFSIETALVRANLDLKHFNNVNQRGEFLFEIHSHHKKSKLESLFGKKETFCVKRDWFERWLSSLRFFWNLSKENGMTPIIPFEEIDNEFIYKTFDANFANTLYFNDRGMEICTDRLIKENIYNLPVGANKNISHLFFSQNYWIDNTKCTYEFNIKKLYELEDFIYNKFGEKIEITENNVQIKTLKNKIILDDTLRNYIWELFEKPYDKTLKKIM